jgi:NADPH:quinone reductase-like Zn-dependent oxidoreductase
MSSFLANITPPPSLLSLPRPSSLCSAFLQINGLSFLRPTVGVAGTFGVGTVSATGADVRFSSPPSQVLVLSKNGTWTNQLTTKSAQVFDVSSLSSEQAALVPDVASAWYLLNKSLPVSSSSATVSVLRTNQNSQIFNYAFDAIAASKGYKVFLAQASDFNDSKFQERVLSESNGGVSLILSPFPGKANRQLFRLLKQNGTIVTYNGLTIPSLEEAALQTGGIEGPTTRMIFQSHQVKGFSFASLAYHEPTRAREAIDAAVQLLLKGNGTELKSVKKFSEEKVLEAIASAEAGETALLTIQ